MDQLVNTYSHKTVNPHLLMIPKEKLEIFIFDIIKQYQKEQNKDILTILDIGGGKGWSKLIQTFPGCIYDILDLNCSISNSNFIKGDITSLELNLSKKYDIIFTKDTFEHILNPWDSTVNIINNLEENGLFIFIAPFSWRYHASPFDTFRYSHTGAQYIFERLGKMKKVFAGYIPFGDSIGFWKNNKDKTLDNKPYPKCIETLYIGKKDSAHVYSKDNLDADYSWNHTE